MEARASSSLAGDRTFLRGVLGGLKEPVAQAVAASGGDVAMVIDRHGVIRDIALGNEEMAREGAHTWLDRPWAETVTPDSRRKIEDLLSEAVAQGRTRWREVNHVTPTHESLMIRYVAVDTGHEGHVVAIGRDERAVVEMQQRLVAAQQSMERDYSRLRDAEFRYRLLFQTSSEAVLVIDPASRRIMEANPAALAIAREGKAPLSGEPFVGIFDVDSQDAAAALLTLAGSTAQADRAQARLSLAGRTFAVSASLFRQDRGAQCLVRLTPEDRAQPTAPDAAARLQAVMERMPDGFVLTDDGFRILGANAAFLELVRMGAEAQVLDQPLSRFLGRAGLDRNLLLDSLREHGYVRNFATLVRDQYDEQEDVEVSAVSAPDGPVACFGFTIRRIGRRLADRPQAVPELGRSVEQLTELVGRVKLKDLVRETTDLVERLCIEAALELTKDNRASAADILGLSRQSLYSKLHRFGLVNPGSLDN